MPEEVIETPPSVPPPAHRRARPLSDYGTDAASYGALALAIIGCLSLLGGVLGVVVWLHSAATAQIAAVDARLGQVDARLGQQIGTVDTRLGQQIGKLDEKVSKVASDLAELRTEVRVMGAEGRAQFAELKELIKQRK